MDLRSLHYQSKVRLIIGLEALEMDTYQYHTDALGNRIYGEDSPPFWWFNSSYADRDGILEFIQKEPGCLASVLLYGKIGRLWTDGDRVGSSGDRG